MENAAAGALRIIFGGSRDGYWKNREALLCSCAAAAFFVGAGQDVFAQTKMASNTDNDGIETVVVTGTRTEAAAIKQDAPNVLDVQSLQEIRSLPDVNAAEALERIPGVSLKATLARGASSISAALMPISTARPMMASVSRPPILPRRRAVLARWLSMRFPPEF